MRLRVQKACVSLHCDPAWIDLVMDVVQVSHDEHLISGSVDELWVVSDGKATPFHGTFAEYKKTLRV